MKNIHVSPTEEPKQETLEEFAKQEAIKQYSEDTFGNLIVRKSIEKGAKWQQEKMYSEEEVISFLQQYRYDLSFKKTPNLGDTTKQWFEQFKNK